MKSIFYLSAALALSSAAAKAESQKPNILFLIADDLRPELPCYGAKHVKSPNIDALAHDGTVFNNAYVQYAVSAATRASFLTGCRPAATGVRYPYSEYFVHTFIKDHPSVMKHLYDNGYYVRTLGKIHHGYKENFSEKHFDAMKDSDHQEDTYALPENIAVQKNKTLRPAVECADVPDNVYKDGKVADEALATIRRAVKDEKPFFISVGFLKPHLPFTAPKKYWDLYQRDKLPLSEYPEATVGETPYSRSHVNIVTYIGESDADGHIVSDERARELRHGYFACISFMDAQVGKIISELKKQGVYDNTAIILIGDHGWHLGDNGMWGKQTNFERATRTPLIVKAPKGKQKQVKETTKFTEFVDIYPAVCEFAGVKAPDFLEGTSLMPLLYDKNAKWKPAAFSEFVRGKIIGLSVRDADYRYTEWRNGRQGEVVAAELYDHRKDPYEKVNIAKDNPQVCARMRKILDQGWRAALPEGVTNYSDNPIAPNSPGWGPEAEARKAREKKTSAVPFEELMEEAFMPMAYNMETSNK